MDVSASFGLDYKDNSKVPLIAEKPAKPDKNNYRVAFFGFFVRI
jgi:hypothetical protein